MRYFLIYRSALKTIKVKEFKTRELALVALKRDEPTWEGELIFAASRDLKTLRRVYSEWFR